MTSIRTLTAAALAAAVATPTAIALASTSHAKLWGNAANTMGCGLEQTVKGKKPSIVLCGAHGIPKPKGTLPGAPGDPYVQLTRTGKPKLVLISQFSYVTDHSTRLSNGTTWSSVGVTCKLGKTVKCTNKSKHGFKIGNGKYKPF